MPTSFNAGQWLVDRHLAAGNGDKIAVVDNDGEMSYASLADRVDRIAAGMSSLDIRPEERVVLFTADSADMIAVLLATIRIGSIAVPVSTMFTPSDLRGVLRDSRATTLIASPEFTTTVNAAVADAPDLRQVITLSDADIAAPPSLPVHRLADLLPTAASGVISGRPPYETWEDSPALWLYTSGTTGVPKAAMHRHASIRAVAETYATKVLGIRPDDRCFSVAKLFFAYGIGNSLWFPLSVGATAVIESRRPTPQLVAERLLEDQPTLFFGGPAFFSAILAAGVPKEVFASVRLAASAGECLPAPLQQRFTDMYGVPIIDGIGSTEALHIFLSNSPDDIRPGTTGRVVPGYDLQLLDDNDVAVPDGEPGTLYVRGPSLATGYWCRDNLTRQVFRGEWLRTGDTYVRDAEGYYTCLGREADLIKAGGIWVTPLEVEHRLTEHPAVARAVVVGVRNAEGLETPVAFVILEAGSAATPDHLIDWCKEGMASYKRPRHIFVIDELPTNANGKIQRAALRERASTTLRPGASAAAI